MAEKLEPFVYHESSAITELVNDKRALEAELNETNKLLSDIALLLDKMNSQGNAQNEVSIAELKTAEAKLRGQIIDITRRLSEIKELIDLILASGDISKNSLSQ